MNLFHPNGFAIACDECGKTFSHGGRETFNSGAAARMTAKVQGWACPKDYPFKDLCPECREKAKR